MKTDSTKDGMKERPNHKQITLSLITLKDIEERRKELGARDNTGEFKLASYDKAVQDIVKHSMRPKDRIKEYCKKIKNIVFVHYGGKEELSHIVHLFEYLILYSMKSLDHHKQVDMILNEVIKQLKNKR